MLLHRHVSGQLGGQIRLRSRGLPASGWATAAELIVAFHQTHGTHEMPTAQVTMWSSTRGSPSQLFNVHKINWPTLTPCGSAPDSMHPLLLYIVLDAFMFNFIPIFCSTLSSVHSCLISFLFYGCNLLSFFILIALWIHRILQGFYTTFVSLPT